MQKVTGIRCLYRSRKFQRDRVVLDGTRVPNRQGTVRSGVIVAGVAVLAIIVIVCVIFEAMSRAARFAVDEVCRHPEVTTALGEPLAADTIRGEVSGSHARMTFRLHGPNGDATCTVDAVRLNDRWEYRRLVVRPDGTDAIDLTEAANSAPANADNDSNDAG